MMKKISLNIVLMFVILISFGQKLPVKMEEMTALEFKDAVVQSSATCIIPIGVLEKHGTHLPLGTDLIDVREISIQAAQKEYAIVFPPYIFSQILEARHQPGTMAYSIKVIWDVLQETCDELNRNGIKKIVLINGHGGNGSFLPFFCNAQLASKRDYAVILFQPGAMSAQTSAEVKKLKKPGQDGHAGQTETSRMLAHHPDLVHMDRLGQQSFEDQKRITGIQGSTGINWYARFPNHYAGDASPSTKELGQVLVNDDVEQITKFLKQVKENKSILELQDQFYKDAENPLNTKQ
jgi:creatinine amidohydrolase